MMPCRLAVMPELPEFGQDRCLLQCFGEVCELLRAVSSGTMPAKADGESAKRSGSSTADPLLFEL